MRKPWCAVTLACCLVSGMAAAADIEAGRVRAESCQACHGAQGISEISSVPSLAGQQDRFLQWQLVFFRNGRRGNEIMGPIAKELSDEEIRNLGAYYASLPRGGAPASDADPELRQIGKRIAAQHRCAACHNESYGGYQAAPAIAHQHKDYLIKALTDYRAAARPSVGVAAMTEAAARLSDEDIRAIAHFLEAFE